MSTEKNVFNKLFTNKVKLASQKFEFALVDSIIKYRGQIADDYLRAQGLASSSSENIIGILKNVVLKANKNLEDIAKVKKMISDLGIDIPNEIVESESITKNQINKSESALKIWEKVKF